MRPMTSLAVENGVGKLAANVRRMSARERERGELPLPNLSLSDRKVGQGLFVSRQERQESRFRGNDMAGIDARPAFFPLSSIQNGGEGRGEEVPAIFTAQ